GGPDRAAGGVRGRRRGIWHGPDSTLLGPGAPKIAARPTSGPISLARSFGGEPYPTRGRLAASRTRALGAPRSARPPRRIVAGCLAAATQLGGPARPGRERLWARTSQSPCPGARRRSWWARGIS